MLEDDPTLVEELSADDQQFLEAAERLGLASMDPNSAPRPAAPVNDVPQVSCPTSLRPLSSNLCTDRREEKAAGWQRGIEVLGG